MHLSLDLQNLLFTSVSDLPKSESPYLRVNKKFKYHNDIDRTSMNINCAKYPCKVISKIFYLIISNGKVCDTMREINFLLPHKVNSNDLSETVRRESNWKKNIRETYMIR